MEELNGHLHAPESLSQRNALRLAEACRAGFSDLIRATLAAAGRAEAPAQWNLLAPILAEAEETRRDILSAPGRPRRLSRPRPDLLIRRDRGRGGYSLHFSGWGATSMLMDAMFDEIDRIFLR